MVEQRIIIAGSRSFTDYHKFKQIFSGLFPVVGYIQIVSGTARGADQLGERYAEKWNIPLKRFPADWDKHGKAAGHIRNQEMAEYADVLVAFWDGESKGTKSMIDKALKEKLETHVYLI